MDERARWFSAKNNGVLHHVLHDGGALCNASFRPQNADDAWLPAELPDGAKFCSRCQAKLARRTTGVVRDEPRQPTPVTEEPKKLTATQVWNCLTLLQRESLLSWFVGSYAPGRNAARFPLRKTPALTHAESIIAEKWQGMQP